MLPFVLVLFVATSAFAAPQSVQLYQVNQNEANDNSIIGSALSIVDGGDINVHTLSVIQDLGDLYANPALRGQALGQAVAVLGELATGRPGDSCSAAKLVNAYTRYVRSGNPAGVREALSAYVQQLSNSVDLIVRLAANPEAARYASGSRGGCSGDGRSYDFEGAWDTIIGTNGQSSAVYGEYCSAKRLYCAANVRNNNVGAQVTASSLPPVSSIFNQALGPLSNFLRAVPSKNVGGSAAALKRALSSALQSVQV